MTIWRRWQQLLVDALTLPAAPDGRERRKQFLSLFIMSTMVLLTMLLLIHSVEVLTRPSVAASLYLLAETLSALVFLGIWRWNQAGQTPSAALAYVAYLVLGISVFFPIGVLDRVLFAYALPTMAASFILRPTGSFWTALAATAAYTLHYLVAAPAIGYNYPAPLVLLLMAFAAWYIAERLETTLRQAQASQTRYQALVEQLPAVVYLTEAGRNGRWLYASPQSTDLLGFAPEEWLKDPGLWFRQVHPEDADRVNAAVEHSRLTGEPLHVEYRLARRDGHYLWIGDDASVIRLPDEPPRLQGVIVDSTRRKEAEAALLASLREKEVLLREIHHRVKNNLQVMASLLSLQAEHAGDAAAHSELRESQDRIRSMALVHEELYQSSDLAQVDFASYLEKLATTLLHVYGAGPLIQLRLEVDSGLLAVDNAIPCGLIVNELVSNALKHAFPGGRAGQIWVWLRACGPEWELVVGDDGVGLPDGLNPQATHSLGLQLVHVLARQLQGTLELDGSHGTQYTLRFAGVRKTSERPAG